METGFKKLTSRCELKGTEKIKAWETFASEDRVFGFRSIGFPKIWPWNACD